MTCNALTFNYSVSTFHRGDPKSVNGNKNHFTIYFLSALKKQLLLSFVVIHFFLVPTFAVTPIPFLEEAPTKKPAESSGPRFSSSRQEAASGNTSSIEERGTRVAILEAQSEHDSTGRNETLNRALSIDDNDFLAEHELAIIDRARSESEEASTVIATALHHPPEIFSTAHHFVPLSSAAVPVVTISVAHAFDESPVPPITAMHSSAYLKNIRSRLFPQYDACVDEHQLSENEMAVNRAALADGLSPEELRVLRAQETYEFFLPAFKEVQKHVMSAFFRFYHLTRDTTQNSSEVWGEYSVAVKNQKEIFEACQEAEQELEAALNAWRATGGVSIVAREIRDEENSPR